MKRNFVVAIDGPAASGKSTIAKMIADLKHMDYLDTGAMYRAYTLYVLDNHINPDDEIEINKNLKNITLSFDARDIYMNNVNISKEIRSKEVTALVSKVCAYKEVREFMVKEQRRIANESNNGVILDGRDIGTVVFPDAKVKIFLTANYDIRAIRRKKDFDALNIDMSLEEIKQDLIRRDKLDSTRAIAPLKQASDAVYLDNSDLTLEGTLNAIIKIIEEKENA